MVYLVSAAILAFLISVVFGRRFVPWLDRKGVKQPVKVEVDRIYQEKEPE